MYIVEDDRKVHHDDYLSVQTITGAEMFSTASNAIGSFSFPYSLALKDN